MGNSVSDTGEQGKGGRRVAYLCERNLPPADSLGVSSAAIARVPLPFWLSLRRACSCCCGGHCCTQRVPLPWGLEHFCRRERKNALARIVLKSTRKIPSGSTEDRQRSMSDSWQFISGSRAKSSEWNRTSESNKRIERSVRHERMESQRASTIIRRTLPNRMGYRCAS